VSHEKRYYVYILSSKGRVLYVGVTGFLMLGFSNTKPEKADSPRAVT
jgi:predicted GIY-YIG superfamily endonuclease